MEEDHCLRSQVINLCKLKKKTIHEMQLDFQAGSIETLLNMVSMNHGITIIPELVLNTLSEERKKKIYEFSHPTPVREISLLTYRHFAKENLLATISNEILNAVSPLLQPMVDQQKIIKI